MTLSPSTRALLQLSLVKGVGPARLRKALAVARTRGMELDEVIARRALDEILTPAQCDELVDARALVALLVDKLFDAEVEVLGVEDAAYPAQLRRTWGAEQAPPLLMARGNLGLLGHPAVGFCGSRQASPRGLSVAADCAEQLGAARVVVTSGFAAGVDTCAHGAALSAGGATTLVLAEGILHFKLKAELDAVWSWDRACVVSEFPATAVWSAGNAMQRNRTIVGLSRAMILIEARATGGSIAAGREALRAGVPLFAAEYEGMPEAAVGNRELIQLGATPLLRSRQTMRASLDGVLGAVQASAPASADAGLAMSPRQLPLLT